VRDAACTDSVASVVATFVLKRSRVILFTRSVVGFRADLQQAFQQWRGVAMAGRPSPTRGSFVRAQDMRFPGMELGA
jgi:hypothetical protein